MGVLVRRAGLILALGIVLGMLVGGAVTASVITLSLREAADQAAATAAVAAAGARSPSPRASAAPSPTGIAYTDVGVPGAPAGAVTALGGTAVVNARIGTDRDVLAATMAKHTVTSIEIARGLRSLAADAALGRDLTARMVGWTAANSVVVGLDDLYVAVAEAARTGLRASLSDEGAYRTAGTAMLRVLDGLGPVDGAAREFAASIAIELTPVTPSAPPAATPRLTVPPVLGVP